MGAILLGPWIASFEVADEASDLGHALAMKLRKPLFEATFHTPKPGRPEDQASQEQKRRPDWPWQQQSADPADDQKDTKLFGQALYQCVRVAVFRRLARNGYSRQAACVFQSIHTIPLVPYWSVLGEFGRCHSIFILLTAAATDEPSGRADRRPFRPSKMETLCGILKASVDRGRRPVWTTAERRKLLLTRVAVILHERLGHWNRQLRPRLHDRPVRWFETRSRADLDSLLIGLACPVVLIDLGRQPIEGLKDLGHIVDRAPDARVLVLDPEAHDQVAGLARELGATHVAPGFVPPPFVARLLARWIELAERQIERDGWSRTSFPQDPDRALGLVGRFPGRFATIT